MSGYVNLSFKRNLTKLPRHKTRQNVKF